MAGNLIQDALDQEFPQRARGRIFLNHAGVSPIPTRAAKALSQFSAEAHDLQHDSSSQWWKKAQEVRDSASRLIGAQPGEVAFTRSTTHGLQIIAQSLQWNEGECIVVDEKTFPANWYVWKSLEERWGIHVIPWPERDFRYEIQDLESLLKENRVRLVSISAVDYATGFRHDLKAVGERCRRHDALLCLDAIQLIGSMPFDVNESGADFVSADGHKWLLSIESAGLLYVRKERLEEMSDVCVGWMGRKGYTDYDARELPPDPSARRFEEGAPNNAGIRVLGASLSLFQEAGMSTVGERLHENTEALREGIRTLGWKLVSPEEHPHMSGIVITQPAGCDSGEIVRFLREQGVTSNVRRAGLRLAPHFYQTKDDMERVIGLLADFSRGPTF